MLVKILPLICIEIDMANHIFFKLYLILKLKNIYGCLYTQYMVFIYAKHKQTKYKSTQKAKLSKMQQGKSISAKI